LNADLISESGKLTKSKHILQQLKESADAEPPANSSTREMTNEIKDQVGGTVRMLIKTSRIIEEEHVQATVVSKTQDFLQNGIKMTEKLKKILKEPSQKNETKFDSADKETIQSLEEVVSILKKYIKDRNEEADPPPAPVKRAPQPKNFFAAYSNGYGLCKQMASESSRINHSTFTIYKRGNVLSSSS